MANFLLIGVCMLAGILIRRYGSLPVDAHKGINTWIIYIALPAVSFKYLPHIQWSRELILPAVSPLVVWLASWLWIRWYAKRKKISKQTEGGLKLVSGLSNTSFIGFPLIAAYFGEQYIGIAIICDQVTFLLLSTAGIIVAMNSSEKHSLAAGVVSKRLLTFPPFLGCMLALVLPELLDLSSLDPFFDKLALTVGPLALFSIGLQLRIRNWRRHAAHLWYSLGYKLFMAPALVLALVLLSGVRGAAANITVFEAAMPTLLSAGIIADEYELNPDVSNLVIGVGIILSFLSSALWWLAIRYLL